MSIDVSGGQYCLRWGRPYFYYSILDECNIDRFRLLHDTCIFPVPIKRLLIPSLRMKVYNVGAHKTR